MYADHFLKDFRLWRSRRNTLVCRASSPRKRLRRPIRTRSSEKLCRQQEPSPQVLYDIFIINFSSVYIIPLQISKSSRINRKKEKIYMSMFPYISIYSTYINFNYLQTEKSMFARRFVSFKPFRTLVNQPRFFNSTASHTAQLVKPGTEKIIGGWLFLAAAGVLGMIVLGGYTRLTHSGLSMADWSPYTKYYPRNPEEWNVQFQKYKNTIEFQTVNKDMDIEGFKPIYWVEFFHRKMGMWLGYYFMIPLSVFMYKGYLMPKMRNRILALLGLGGLQGAIGWWMVKSGLKEKPEYQTRPRVSPYRLATHLTMATALYSGLIWNAFALLIKPIAVDPSETAKLKYVKDIRVLGIVLIHCLIFNIITGAFVAGIDAGKVYNTWPLMNGQVVPPGLTEKKPLWINFTQNMTMVQFNHRNMAYVTMSVSYLLLHRIMKAKIGGPITVAGLIAVMMINYQAFSGIITLLQMVPKQRANVHQMTAIVTLTSAILMCYLAKVPIPPVI